jgi:hypothetical protein
MSSWFSGGFAQAKAINDGQGNGSFEFGNNEKSRFWLKDGQSRQIIFLDDFNWSVSMDGNSVPIIPFCRYEHKAELNGDWRNNVYLTCTRGASPCKCCDSGFKRIYVGAMSILDVTPFKDEKTGKMIVRPRKKLLVAVPSALMILQGKKEKKGNLLGWKYSVARHTKKDPKVGSDFEAEEQISDLKEFIKSTGTQQEVNLDPYGFTAEKAFEYYRKLFAPMPADQQERLFNGAVEDGSVMRQYRKGSNPSSSSSSSSSPSFAGGEDDSGEDVIKY